MQIKKVIITTLTALVLLESAMVPVCLFGQGVQFSVAFLLYQVFAILGPGFALFAFLRIRSFNLAEVLFVSYLAGYACNIIAYYGSVLIGGGRPDWIVLLVIFLAMDVYGIHQLLQRQSVISIAPMEGWDFLVSFAFIEILYILEIYTYCSTNAIVPDVDAIGTWPDLRYWIGNTVSLKLGYPPFDFRTLFDGYTYHYFSSIQLAVESVVTGIPALELSVYYSFVQAILLLCGGAYCLFHRIGRNPLYMAAAYSILFLSSGYETITRMNWISHMYICQAGFDYSIGISLYMLSVMERLVRGEVTIKRIVILLGAFALLLGVKAPIACIMLVGVGIILLVRFIHERNLGAFAAGVAILVVFAFLYVTTVSASGYSNGGYSIDLTIHHWDKCEDLLALREGMQGKVPAVLFEIFFWFFYAMLCNPVLFGLLFVCVLVTLCKYRKLDLYETALLGMIVVGMSICLYIFMAGKSNTYFGMATYPVTMAYVLYSLRKYQFSNAWTVPVMMAAMLVGICVMNGHIGYDGYGDFKGYITAFKDKLAWLQEDPYGTSGEYELLTYIRENLPENATILAVNDRPNDVSAATNYTSDDNNLAGIIAERRTKNMSADAVAGDGAIAAAAEAWHADYLLIADDYSNEQCTQYPVVATSESWALYALE